MQGITMNHVVLNGDLLLAVHTNEEPLQDEWEEYLKTCQAHLNDLRVALAVTAGGRPNSKQRAQVIDAVAGRSAPLPGAIITDSTTVRGVVRVLTWLDKKAVLRAFAPEEMAAAFDYLGIPKYQRAGIEKSIGRLRDSLNYTDKEVT